MGPAVKRRDFLQILLGSAPAYAFGSGAAALASRSSLSAQQPARSLTPLSVTPLNDRLLLITGAGANVVVAAGPDGLVMINGGLESRSAELFDVLARHAGGKPVRAVFNTDWHRERTGSNGFVGTTGGRIIAHEYAKQYLGAEIYVDWQDRAYKPLPAQALPNHTFYTSGELELGFGAVKFGHLGQAHTDAAIYVFLPGANVLVAGGALSVGKYPIADYTTGGWLGGLVAANKTLLGLADADTLIVPDAGPVQSRADLQAQHDMLASLMDRFANMMRQGLGPDDIIAAAATKEYDAAWGNPDLFVATSYRSMWLHVRELGKIV